MLTLYPHPNLDVNSPEYNHLRGAPTVYPLAELRLPNWGAKCALTVELSCAKRSRGPLGAQTGNRIDSTLTISTPDIPALPDR